MSVVVLVRPSRPEDVARAGGEIERARAWEAELAAVFLAARGA